MGNAAQRSAAGRTSPGKLALHALWMGAATALIVGSLLPGDSSALAALSRLSLDDKDLHFCAYAVLLFLPGLHERISRLAIHAAGALLLGVALEFAQLLCPGRGFEVADMAADARGVACGLAGAFLIRACLQRVRYLSAAWASSNTVLKNPRALGDGPMWRQPEPSSTNPR